MRTLLESRMKTIAIGILAALSLIGADQLLSEGLYTRQANKMAQSMAHGFGVR